MSQSDGTVLPFGSVIVGEGVWSVAHGQATKIADSLEQMQQALCSTCPPPDKMVSHVQDVIDRLRDMKNRVTGQDVTTVREGEELLDELLHRCGINQAQDAVFSGRFGTVDGLALARARDALIQIVRLCEEDERCNADCFADIAKAAHTALTVTE